MGGHFIPKYIIASDNDRGNLDTMKKVLSMADEKKSDIIFAGDFGPVVCNNPDILRETNRSIYTVPGNQDTVKGYDKITNFDHVIDLHNNIHEDFVGYGGSYEIPAYPGANPRDWYCRELDETDFYKLIKKAKKEDVSKLILHKPPEGLGDEATFIRTQGGFRPAKKNEPGAVTENVGQPFVRYVLDSVYDPQPRLVAGGHIHESMCATDLNGNPIEMKTNLDNLFINPGPTFAGYMAMVEDDPIENKIRYMGHIKV